MKLAERIVLVAIAVVFIGGTAWLYFTITYQQKEVRDAVARGEYEIRDTPTTTDEVAADEQSSVTNSQADWRQYYPTTVPLIIGSTTVAASVADTLSERIKGLSGTPYLPEGLVKLFAFGVEGQHSIWMKDMNYAIDIIWVAKDGSITHIEENVSPESYPKSFASPAPAWYVIEASAGFVAAEGITKKSKVIVPTE